MDSYMFTITVLDWPHKKFETTNNLLVDADSEDSAIAQVTNDYVFGEKQPDKGTFQTIEYKGEILSCEFF